MSEAQFDGLAEALSAQRWDLPLEDATALAPKARESLRAAAQWATRFDVGGGWFKADYALLAAPEHSPPKDRITQVVSACRANGESSRYGATYIDLVLRWSWAEDHIALDGLTPPYEGIKTIFLAGSGLSGEHGFIGPGLASLRIGSREDHL